MAAEPTIEVFALLRRRGAPAVTGYHVRIIEHIEPAMIITYYRRVATLRSLNWRVLLRRR
jgi:hypothetical protein